MRKIPVYLIVLLTAATAYAQDTKENADFKLAVNLYNDKLYDLAHEQFRQFISFFPNTQSGIEARFYLGLTESKLGKFDDARITFQNFALAYPDHPKAPEAWWNAAEAYVALKNYREAALAFERVKTFHPKSRLAPSALSKAAEYFELVNDTDNAKKVLRSLTQEYGSSEILPYRLTLAALLIADGQFEQARVECKLVADAAKDASLKARALLLMAQTIANLGRPQEAEAALNQIVTGLRSTPSYHTALLAMGRLRRDAGNRDEAIAAWKTVADDSTRAPAQVRQDALIELGDICTATNEYAKAMNFFDRAASLKGSRSGEAFYKAGRAAEKSKNNKLAATEYARAFSDTSGIVDRRAVMIGAFKGAVISRSFGNAVTVALEYAKKFPGDAHLPRLMYEAAEVCRLELSEPSRAAELYRGVVDGFPRSRYVDDALFGLGNAYRDLKQYELAIETFESMPKKYPGSEYIARARNESERIQRYDLKGKEAGLEKLALLVGDVIEQKSKGNLAFRLAEIYFHEMKDYGRAASQYESALRSGLDAPNVPSAWFYLAKSCEYESGRARDGGRNGVDVARAVAAYDSLLRKFPANEHSDEAQISQLTLKLLAASTGTEVRKVSIDFMTAFPNARQKDRALVAIANSFRSVKNLEDAAGMYRTIVEKYLQSELFPEALFQYAATLLEMGEKDSSAKLLNRFMLSYPYDPESVHAAAMLARYETERGNAREAVAWYDEIEKQYYYSAYNKDISLLKADAYDRAGDAADAVQAYEQYLGSLANDFFEVPEISADVIYRIASAYGKLGRRAEARRYYAQYLTRDASSERAGTVYYSLAVIARAENQLDLAAKYLQEASRLSPASDKPDLVTLEAAELLFRNEQYNDAISRYSEVAQKVKTDSLQRYLQSRIIVAYFRLDNIKEADRRAAGFLKTYTKAVNEAAEFDFERGKYLIRRDELDKAKQRFDLVTRQYPQAPVVPEAMYWLARTYELQEKPQNAVQMYDSVIRYYPKSAIVPKAQLGLGNVYYNLEQWDAAAKLYKAILDNPERSPDLVRYAMNNLILTYKELALYDAALELTRKYIANYPDDPELIDKRIDIGVLYQKLGYYDQSVMHLQGLLEEGKAEIEPELHYYVGESYFYKGEYQQAILEFLKVPYLSGRKSKVDWTATSYYMAGQSYEKMSKFDQAMTMYRQIIDRPGIDVTFKTAAQREIDRVKTLVEKK